MGAGHGPQRRPRCAEHADDGPGRPGLRGVRPPPRPGSTGARPSGPAVDPGREGPRRPPSPRRFAAPRPGGHLRGRRSRSGGPAGRPGPDRGAAVHDGGPRRGDGPHDRALRSPHPRPGPVRGRPAHLLGRQRRGLRVPAGRVRRLRHRFLGARFGDHPPGRPRELRLPGRDDDRHRQPHPQRRRPGHDRRGSGRRRRHRRHDRVPVQRALAPPDRRAPDGPVVGLVVGQGRHPRAWPVC